MKGKREMDIEKYFRQVVRKYLWNQLLQNSKFLYLLIKYAVFSKDVLEMSGCSDLVAWLLCSSASHLTNVSASYIASC